MRITQQQKNSLIELFPDLREWFDQQEINESLKESIEAIKVIEGPKGNDGHTPTPEEIQALIKPLIPEVKDGENYVLTDGDVEAIASLALAQIEVPIVEKIIEKTIVKDRPIVTEVVKEKAVTDTAPVIAEKLNSLINAVDISVIKDAVSKKDLDIKLEEGSKRMLAGMAEVDGRVKAIDQRWHGGGLSKVSTDATLSGTGTPSNPLSVIGGGASPAGVGTELQYRLTATTFGAIPNSSWTAITGTLNLGSSNIFRVGNISLSGQTLSATGVLSTIIGSGANVYLRPNTGGDVIIDQGSNVNISPSADVNLTPLHSINLTAGSGYNLIGKSDTHIQLYNSGTTALLDMPLDGSVSLLSSSGTGMTADASGNIMLGGSVSIDISGNLTAPNIFAAGASLMGQVQIQQLVDNFGNHGDAGQVATADGTGGWAWV